MNISENISSEDLSGNITGNASGKVVLSDGLLVPVGIVMILENIISIILLWKCTRLLFQIRILSLNLALSDLFTGIFLSIPNTLLFEEYRCDIKKYACFFFYKRISSNRYDDESRSLLCFCLCHALLFVYHKETDHQVKCFVLDPGYFSDLWNVFRVWIWKWIVLWTHGFFDEEYNQYHISMHIDMSCFP